MFYIHPVKNTVLFFLLLSAAFCHAQTPYWQQRADVTINVQLNDTAHTLDGVETIIYTNHSPDTLRFIWFHLWPNAYKNDRTAFSNQMLQLGNTDFYFASKKERGYINRLAFKVNGITALVEDDPEHIDIVKLLLPVPLSPHQQLTITTPFHVKLPYLFSRSGYKNGVFQITQWYPKPAVYDAQGWHPMPYLEQGEFYSEFGNYDVAITLPEDYKVAATGVLQNGPEKATSTFQKNEKQPVNKSPQAAKQHGRLKKLSPTKKAADTNFFKTPYRLKTLQYKQDNVHDFAWVASKTFQVESDTCRLQSGKVISVYTYYFNRPKSVWSKSVQLTKNALRFYSSAVGDYPYQTVRIVESPGMAGGMEYPALSIIGPTTSEKDLAVFIAHEVGHNWFQGALATNERDAPWLDEGLNSFYEKKFSAQQNIEAPGLERLFFKTLVTEKEDQPITTTSTGFSEINYGLVAYTKTAEWLELVEKKAGNEGFKKAMQQYYKQWSFKHPQAADFNNILATALPDTTVFSFLNQYGSLPNQQLLKTKFVSPLAPRTIKSFMQHPTRKLLLFSPAFGYNNYDKAMVGGLLTNYTLPPARLQFIVVPLYATGSKKWNGIGNINYSIYSSGKLQKVEASVSGMGFSKSYMLDSNGRSNYERFYKATPALRITLRPSKQRTNVTWVEARTYFIQEKAFSKFVTKQTNGLTYVDSLSKSTRYLNQLTWNTSDYRVLYPYNYQLQLQQGQAFYRINITGNYFFNYRKGGASVRLFFSKFGYLTNNLSQRLSAMPYQPKLLGNTGDEDYTYSTYFLGRSASYANDASVVKNSGLAAQQIMLRDGGFKLRLDPFEFLQGRSENWVAAMNLNTTLPRKLLPAGIPLKVFLDIGTYAEAATQQTPGSRILYVGGLQLGLVHDVITIYAPLVYSSVFRDNLKSLPEQNTFSKRLTFSIDISRLSLRRLSQNKFWL